MREMEKNEFAEGIGKRNVRNQHEFLDFQGVWT
jgi:hypothetical protein